MLQVLVQTSVVSISVLIIGLTPRALAERALGKHSVDMWNALIELFEFPVTEGFRKGREVLTSILGSNNFPFDKPIFDFASN